MASIQHDKRCSRCGETKPLDDFYRAKSRPDGRQAYCKQCKKSVYSQYAKENAESVKEAFRAWSANNRADRAEYLANWRAENAAAKADYNRKWRKENRARHSEYHKEYRRKRAGYYRAKKAAYRAAVNEATVHSFTEEDLSMKLEYWGGRCAYCRVELSGGFHWDHWRPISKGGSHSVSNLHPACAACNLAKSNKWPYTKPEVSVNGKN